MLLSPETRDGLRMTSTSLILAMLQLYSWNLRFTWLYFYPSTAHSFVELVRYLFQIPGVKVFLSRRLCQDPLEKFFGCQRQIGATHDNPSLKEFQQNTQALRVVNSFCRVVAKGNCRGNKGDAGSTFEKEKYPLPKRSSCRAKNKSSKWTCLFIVEFFKLIVYVEYMQPLHLH